MPHQKTKIKKFDALTVKLSSKGFQNAAENSLHFNLVTLSTRVKCSHTDGGGGGYINIVLHFVNGMQKTYHTEKTFANIGMYLKSLMTRQ